MRGEAVEGWPNINFGGIDPRLRAVLLGSDVQRNVFQSAKSATSSQITDEPHKTLIPFTILDSFAAMKIGWPIK